MDYIDTKGNTRVEARTVTAGKKIIPAGRRLLISQAPPFTNHKGGQLAIGPDGYLYISFGDGGSGGDPQDNGQNKNTLLGKILRIGLRDVEHCVELDLRRGVVSDQPLDQPPHRAGPITPPSVGDGTDHVVPVDDQDGHDTQSRAKSRSCGIPVPLAALTHTTSCGSSMQLAARSF